MKTCSRCQCEKPTEDFYARQAVCKSCSVQRAAEWAVANPDRARAAKVRYASKNKDKQRLRAREWARRNKEAVNAKHRAAYDPAESRKRMLQSRYGLSPEQYNQLFLDQGGSCASCGTALVDSASTHVDHCHKTGRVRSILCRRCNTCLGQFDEDAALIRKLAEYADGC
jgi:hypothetical protein